MVILILMGAAGSAAGRSAGGNFSNPALSRFLDPHLSPAVAAGAALAETTLLDCASAVADPDDHLAA